jgi:hypothetical protein
MTEGEWLEGCADPAGMLAFVGDRITERKVRLFACACVRRYWHRLPDSRSRTAVEVAERYAEGQANLAELNAAWSAAGEAFDDAPGFAQEAAWGTADEVNQFHTVAELILLGLADEGDTVACADERRMQCHLLRDLVGNPFRHLDFASWLPWHDGLLVKLAQAINAEGAFDRMPILGDALEEAGCTDCATLDHCRSSEPHARGCWLVDGLLGKE